MKQADWPLGADYKLQPARIGEGRSLASPYLFYRSVNEVDKELSMLLHQLRNCMTVLLGGVETGKLDLAEAALEKAGRIFYDYRYSGEMPRVH